MLWIPFPLSYLFPFLILIHLNQKRNLHPLVSSRIHFVSFTISSLLNSIFSSLHGSIELIDTAVDGAFTSQSLSKSSDSSLLLSWIHSDSKEHFYEPTLCVPRFLTTAIHLLQQNWTTEDLHSLHYDHSVILSMVEYYSVHKDLPSDLSGGTALSGFCVLFFI